MLDVLDAPVLPRMVRGPLPVVTEPSQTTKKTVPKKPHTEGNHAMLRAIEYDGYNSNPVRTADMTRGPSTRTAQGYHSNIDAGIYLHRDDVCDMIRKMGENGSPDLPDLASAIPAWIAEKLRLVG